MKPSRPASRGFPVVLFTRMDPVVENDPVRAAATRANPAFRVMEPSAVVLGVIRT